MDGICTLANDKVLDQVIALLNSIEVMAGKDMPVCIYPYDDRIEKLAEEIAKRPNVQLYSDRDSITKWDNFARACWDTHPTAKETWHHLGSEDYHRFGTHRRYCAFDGPFDRFLYMDADTLLMNSVETIFAQLKHHDCVVYDFQYKDPTHVYIISSKLEKVFPQPRVATEIFCSGFYASKKDLFSESQRNELIKSLQQGDAEILYPMAPDQTLINYMMMRSGFSIYNFSLQLPPQETTGCCVTSPHFQDRDRVLYDREKRLVYLHYIGLSSQLFTKVCAGENIDFPYRDLFLHYRYLQQPNQKPQFITKGKPYNQSPSLKQKIVKKLGLKI